jgi:hypothetical protein
MMCEGGNGRSCVDCTGLPHGSATYDWCDVCNGCACEQCVRSSLTCACAIAMVRRVSTVRVCRTAPACAISAACARVTTRASGVTVSPTRAGRCESACGDASMTRRASSTTCAAIVDRRRQCLCASPDAIDVPTRPTNKCVFARRINSTVTLLQFDMCGVCDGNNTCVGCDGVPFSGVTYDHCDVCAGNGRECEDCFGNLHGNATYNECGCGDDSVYACKTSPIARSVCQYAGLTGEELTAALKCLSGCDMKPYSSATVDVCGVCGGTGTVCRYVLSCCLTARDDCVFVSDCKGTPFGTFKYDSCGYECVRGNARSLLTRSTQRVWWHKQLS